MSRRPPRRGNRDLPGQLHLDWNACLSPAVASPAMAPDVATGETAPRPPRESREVIRLPWDFRTTFPQPTEQALEAGIVTAEDAAPENIRSIHEEHAREMLMALSELETVLDAKRRGVDPRTGKKPARDEAKERLRQFFETEPPQLERWFDNLLAVYADAFGQQAAEAFGKAVHAWHNGVEVVAEAKHPNAPSWLNPTPSVPTVAAETPAILPAVEQPPPEHRTRRVTARLPVPRPLPAAITAGHFGYEDDGTPVHPSADEVRDITEHHAERIVELLMAMPDSRRSGRDAEAQRPREELSSAIAKYAEDFGPEAAERLEAHARRQVRLQERPGLPRKR